MIRAALAVIAALTLSACAHDTQDHAWPDGAGELVVKTSPYSVDAPLDRLAAAAEARGAHVFARIDHAGGAENIGTQLAPTAVLIFGSPQLGTPLIQQQPTVAIDLPVRALAWRGRATTYLAYTDPRALARRHGIDPEDAAITRLSGVLDALTDQAVTAEMGGHS